MDEKVISWIIHCTKKLGRNPEDEVILHMMRKLSKVPVTLELLQATRIGRAIRKISEREGIVGEKANRLLKIWGSRIVKEQMKELESSSKSKKKKVNCILLNSNESRISTAELKEKKSVCDSQDKDIKIKTDGSPNKAKESKKDYSPKSGDSKNYLPKFPDSFYDVTKANKSSCINTEKPSLKHKPNDNESSSHGSSAKKIKLENSNSFYADRQKLEKNRDSSDKHIKPQKTDNTATHKVSLETRKTNFTPAQRQNPESQKINSSKEFTSSEMSFEDCLTANDVMQFKRKSSTKVHKETSAVTASKKIISRKRNCSQGQELTTSKPSHKDLVINVPKPKSHSSKVDAGNITSTLPEIQPFYRPLPRTLDFPISKKKEVLTNEEAIKFTSSRREKTVVYSGRRNHYTKFPSLQLLCIRVLIENIDAIECVGELPYFLFKPVLEKCTPTQLFTIESFNPHFLEDTDELWEIHCKRDYKLFSPLEHESWRDLYLRAFDEREQKLKNVTANISASISKSKPVRQVKLAYVDSYVKPPRDVARKQAKNGTAVAVSHPSKTAMTKSSSRATVPALTAATNSSNTCIPGSSSFFVPKKPKVAPLMAKTLKTIKQCFRRK